MVASSDALAAAAASTASVPAYLLLEDGTRYDGKAFGAKKCSSGEVGKWAITATQIYNR